MHLTRNIRPEIVEERGTIARLLDTKTPLRSVLLITSKAGTVRSNHYHKTDAHYCYVLSGKVEWHEEPVDGGERETAVLTAGDLVYTPPMTAHAARFLEDTVLLCCSTKPRDQATYEEDTVRVKLI